MTIDRLGSIDPASNYNKTGKASKTVKKDTSDTIAVSAEARSKAEIFAATESVRNTPDIRMDKVEEAKRKLQDPSYISKKVVESVADKIIDLFGV